jgi:hypothetical protein
MASMGCHFTDAATTRHQDKPIPSLFGHCLVTA